MSNNELKMTFDPNTIEDLGVRLYSTLPPVLAELIANGYDADAKHVKLILNDEKEEKEITIIDDGMGMSFDEINDKFLRIGRKRRLEEESDRTPRGRKIIGRKGLGKLSFFGIAHTVEIHTQKDGLRNVFRMVWEDIQGEHSEYKPDIIEDEKICPKEESGTKIILKDIQRKTNFSATDIAQSLSKIFIIEDDFRISVKRNQENSIDVSMEMRYDSIDTEIEWRIPDDLEDGNDYWEEKKVKGRLITSEKPIPPHTEMRGITLFSRRKLVNKSECFSASASSNFFSYLTGHLEVDFVDDLKDENGNAVDVIGTNRQSLNWNHEKMKELRDNLKKLVNNLERDWRMQRKKRRRKKVQEKTDIDINQWLNTVPEDVEPIAQVILDTLLIAELPDGRYEDIISKFYKFVLPPYPRYHWRELHKEVKSASKECFENEDYYSALFQAGHRYTNAVQNKIEDLNRDGFNLMEQAFGRIEDKKGSSTGLLELRKRSDKSRHQLSDNLLHNIEEGNKYLSIGFFKAYRNPLGHTEVRGLRDSGLLTELDCLDGLSLLSHLFHRLDRMKKRGN